MEEKKKEILELISEVKAEAQILIDRMESIEKTMEDIHTIDGLKNFLEEQDVETGFEHIMLK